MKLREIILGRLDIIEINSNSKYKFLNNYSLSIVFSCPVHLDGTEVVVRVRLIQSSQRLVINGSEKNPKILRGLKYYKFGDKNAVKSLVVIIGIMRLLTFMLDFSGEKQGCEKPILQKKL